MTIDGAHAQANPGRMAFLGRLAATIGEPARAAPSPVLRRVAVTMLATGAAAAVATIALGAVGAALPDVDFTWRDFLAGGDWYVGYVIRGCLAIVVLRRCRDNAAAAWFGVVTGLELLGTLPGTLPDALAALGAGATAVAAATLAEWTLFGILAVAALQLAIRLPFGGVEDRVRRWANGAWVLVLAPPLAFTTHELVPVPWYAGEATLPNPLQLPWSDAAAGVLTTLRTADESLYLLGMAVVVVRYVRSGPSTRRRLRWMLGVPVVSVALLVTIELFPGMPVALLSALSATAVVAVPVFLALTLLGPDGIDVDDFLRRSLVYGVMWLVIAGLYVGAGALVGTAAGRRLPALGAAVLTVVATLAFQPARRWLERLADQWIFGNRADPAHLVADLGSALEDTYDVDELLPTIEDTLRRGLSVEWARVRLDRDTAPVDAAEEIGEEIGADDEPAALRVPIVLGDEQLGVVECGPRRGRPLGPDDLAVVRTFARQAALALANVRLTTELTTKARQLTESRARLVRAQESERRRIERNIHDGVQQELVSLIQQAGEIEQGHARGVPVDRELEDLRDGLTRLLTTLRELAAGIHPTLLTDRGLLPAVEALAARHPVPVTVRVDRSLRERRFAEAVEGAAYFTVAECLANSLKHAAASRVDVTLGREEESLVLAIEDDGVGFQVAAAAAGNGLGNLAARLEALGGGLTVDARPGGGTSVLARLSLADDRVGRP